MKRTLLIALLVFLPILCFGQNSGALKFLGIPIDGTEAQFAAKLKSKGFRYNAVSEGYQGQFNGKSVNVYLHTNHNLVDRVYVSFPYMNEDGIRAEYNQLLSQFKDNAKYMDLVMNEEIPQDDDISYEISVKNKRYQASFSYFDPDRDKLSFMNALLSGLSEFFTDEQNAFLKEYLQKAAEIDDGDAEELQSQMMTEMQKLGFSQLGDENADPEKALHFLSTFVETMGSLADGEVWFMIHEQYGRYNIGLYYDNLHNRPHGEDL